jgi:tRNA wybutosine-synthesizing protein 1
MTIAIVIVYKIQKFFEDPRDQETAEDTTSRLDGVTINGKASPEEKVKEKEKELPVDPVEIVKPSLGPKATSTTSPKAGPKRVSGGKKLLAKKGKKSRLATAAQDKEEGDFDIQICIFYTSLTGSTAQYAEQLKNELFSDKEGIYPKFAVQTPSNLLSEVPVSRTFLPPQIHNLEEIELDDYFVSPPSGTSAEGKKVKYVYLVIAPSYETDSPNAAFLDRLEDTHHDFRIDTAPLRSLAGFSVFGFGDSAEWPESEGKFCQDAVAIDKWLGKLTGGRAGSRRMFPLGMGDVNPASSKEGKESGTAADNLRDWRIHLEDAIREYAETGELGGGSEWRAGVESGDEDSDVDDTAEEEPEKDMMDLEDLGGMINRSPDVLKKPVSSRPAPLPVDFTTPAGKLALEAGEGQSASRKDMVPKDGVTYKALTKQGYEIVGSHSGVKICRWTKSALRGRGSCYKVRSSPPQ